MVSRNFRLLGGNVTKALLLFIFLIVPGALVLGQEPTGIQTVESLQKALADHIQQEKFSGAIWGIQIASLRSGKIVFEHNPRKLFSPASNSKLYTVALALDRLGPDYRIKTSIYADSKPNARGMLSGDLVLYGRGDPTLNRRLNGSDLFKALEPLVRAVTNAGVRSITGDVVGDETFFTGPPYGSGWSWDDTQYYYGAELSALTINDNILEVTLKPGEAPGKPCRISVEPPADYLRFINRSVTVEKGARRTISFYRPVEQNLVYIRGDIPADDPGYTQDVTVHKPASLFATLFREALIRHGVRVKGKTRIRSWPECESTTVACCCLVEIGSVLSAPLSVVAREIQKPSQNLYTDLLLAHLGEVLGRAEARPHALSEELGIAQLERWLQEIGIPATEVHFEEGSGLSRNNLTTPSATLAVLRHMSRRPAAGVYLAAMPIAGEDGTLRRRMKDTPAAGNVRAKTGTLRWANSLSGHVTTAAGEQLVFSIMLNRYHNLDPASSARAELDAIAVMLAGFSGRVD